MNFLRETDSFCPECLKEIKAACYEGDDGIYMKKSCPEHGDFNARVEKDKEYYKSFMHNKARDFSPRYVSLCIPLTHACNLNCYFCYAPNRDTKNDLTPEKVKELIRDFDGPHILLSGGEPTVCKHLPDYIRYTREVGKVHSLATNGVRLENKDYLRTLLDAGLEEVTLPIYAFEDDEYIRVTGKPLVKNREHNLKNLRDAGIPLTLSYTINRGRNEKDAAKIFEMAFKNADTVYQIRIRSASQAGARTTDVPLYVSELLEIFAGVLDCTVDDLQQYTYDRGKTMETMFDKMYNVPKSPLMFEVHLIEFVKHLASRGNKRCHKLLKMRPKKHRNHPDVRMRPDFMTLTALNWATLLTSDLIYLRAYPLGYHTYSHGTMEFPVAVLLSGRTVEM